MPTNEPLNRKLRMALAGGGQGSFIGRVHATAAVLDNRAALVAKVRAHMLARVDPVFVPRRIRLVDAIPRGDTGKVTVQTMERLRTGNGS